MILQIFSENETRQYQRKDVIEMEFANYFSGFRQEFKNQTLYL